MTPASTHNGKNATVTAGHVVGGSFGVAFIVANSAPMPAVLRGFFIVAAAAVLMLTVYAFGRGVSNGSVVRPEEGDEGFNRPYWILVAIEAVALVGGMRLLIDWQPSAVVGWIALVVGLHFLGLARLWKSGSTEITLIAIALTILGVVGLVISFTADSLAAVGLVSGVGSGVALLASSLHGAVTSRSRRQRIS